LVAKVSQALQDHKVFKDFKVRPMDPQDPKAFGDFKVS
jgi:hypothetical protein